MALSDLESSFVKPNPKPLRRLSVRLVIASLFVSVVLAITVSAAQIYFTYKNSIESAHAVFLQIEKSYQTGLESALWEVNDQGVEKLLDAMAQLPNVGKISLVDELGRVSLRNDLSAPPFAQKEFILRYVEGEQVFSLGKLSVELIDIKILAQLRADAIQIATTPLFAFLGNSIFVLILFHWWISRHLVKIAKFTKEVDVKNLGGTLTLDRPITAYSDELDLVVSSFNRMQKSLKSELTLRASIEKELRDHRDKLEILVEERTLAYKSSTEQLEIAATIAELGVWSWNIELDILVWNDRMFDMYHQPIELRKTGLRFEHWQQCLHPDDVETTLSEVKTTIAKGGMYSGVFRINIDGDVIRHIKVRAQAVQDKSGKTVLLTGINQDITDQIELQSRLMSAKDQADAANAAKSSFLANMSHEIRTPMNAVIGMLHLVQKTGLDNRQRDYIEKAESAAKSLLALLNDILDYSKIEAGKLELDPHPFDFEALMRSLAIILAGNRGQKDVEVIFDLPSRMPAVLIGDSLRLQQILINLAGNALKFTSHGHVKVGVTELSRNNENIRLRFSVSDTGIGISNKQKQTLFTAFSQAETSTTRRFGGTGLGLTISQRLVTLLGGALILQSELGQGSEFSFEVTFGISNTETPSDVIAQTSELCPRILVVDSNPTAGEVLVRSINDFGWTAELAIESRPAIAQIKAAQENNTPYDLVLIDWNMHDIDGVAAARMIRNSTTEIGRSPAIVLTTGCDSESLANLQRQPDAPFINILTKPITPLQLAAAIEKTLCIDIETNDAPSTATQPEFRLADLCLLVVEDNALNRQVAAELLIGEGAHVELANGGLEGVEKVVASAQRFDIVIMDVHMPDIDGLEATRRIRADGRFVDLPILAMTANISHTDREQCFAAGMNGHVGKPIDIDELVAALLALKKQKDHCAPIIQQANLADKSPNTDMVVEDPTSILRRFGGKPALFKRVLSEFSMDTQLMLDELFSQIVQQRYTEAAATLHTLKGTAGTIGARALANKVAVMEKLYRDTPPPTPDRHIIISVIEELKLLLRQCVTLLEAAYVDSSPPAIELNATPPLQHSDWRARLIEGLGMLEVGNLQAIEFIESLASVTPSAYQTQIKTLVVQAQQLDFEAAKATVQQLLSNT